MPAEIANPVLEKYCENNRKPWLCVCVAKGKEEIATVVRQGRILALLLKHSRAPWSSRVVAGCTVSYLLSPIQLIPTFVPVIGQLDDLFVLFIGMKLIRRLTPGEVLAECERRAGSPIFRRRVTGDECGMRARELSDSPAA
jgi:uncharacterized membrane protein YkvA (DUF1232 family)